MVRKVKPPPPPLDPTLAQVIAIVHARRLLNFWMYLCRIQASNTQKHQAYTEYSEYVIDMWETIGPVIEHPEFQTLNAELNTYAR